MASTGTKPILDIGKLKLNWGFKTFVSDIVWKTFKLRLKLPPYTLVVQCPW